MNWPQFFSTDWIQWEFSIPILYIHSWYYNNAFIVLTPARNILRFSVRTCKFVAILCITLSFAILPICTKFKWCHPPYYYGVINCMQCHVLMMCPVLFRWVYTTHQTKYPINFNSEDAAIWFFFQMGRPMCLQDCKNWIGLLTLPFSLVKEGFLSRNSCSVLLSTELNVPWLSMVWDKIPMSWHIIDPANYSLDWYDDFTKSDYHGNSNVADPKK